MTTGRINQVAVRTWVGTRPKPPQGEFRLGP